MKIISAKICPFVQQVIALLEAKEVPYEVEYIDLRNKPEWFLDISPKGQVPVLITDNDFALFESDAIIEYIEEAFPALQPDLSPEQKAINRAWSYQASRNYLPQCSAQRSSTKDDLISATQKLGYVFDQIEKHLADATYFDSETIGRVDIAWLVILNRADIIERRTGYDFLGNRPKLKKWQENLLKSGLAEKSVASDFEDVFTSFYLSEKTFLGSGGIVNPEEFAFSKPASRSCSVGGCG